jgi:ATP-dependent RNA helicase DOB1
MDTDDLFDVFDSKKHPRGAESSGLMDVHGINRKRVKNSSDVVPEDPKATETPGLEPAREKDVDEESKQAKIGEDGKEEEGLERSAATKAILDGPFLHEPASSTSCTHEIAFPPGTDVISFQLEEEKMMTERGEVLPAKKYPFQLDKFQEESVNALERGHSVLVSAHTSAGKTAVAEYAIAMALRENQRVVYTSPIKALSNQKYRELREEFKNVGLMTGDTTIDPHASCLVMTTEILRSMLYRGSEILREVGCVIFDEIHYLRDRDRGVVWEETIILLPDSVRMVFLSATIPNAREFAEWISKLHNQVVDVVYTEYRPVPLQHYMFPTSANGLYLLVDEKGKFREDNFMKCLGILSNAPKSAGGPGGAGKGRRQNDMRGRIEDVREIVKMVMQRKFDPVIVFSFSKKHCEMYALKMASLDFTSDLEKKLIQDVYENAIMSLSEDDQKLPQVENILPLLKRGVGIHHSGLLPILKEVIEILFQESLIKVLFSTETFSLGLNMPARTVVFTDIRKFDGEEFRWLSSGEYIQMSGRAGRRGLDDRGIVTLMVDEMIDPTVAKTMMSGKPDRLNSSFHLSYNMLLNLLRVEHIDPEYLMIRSFRQFQSDRAVPEMKETLKNLLEEKETLSIEDEDDVAEYFHLRQRIEGLREQMRDVIFKPENILPFLSVGRMVHVKDGEDDFGYGILVNFQKKRINKKGRSKQKAEDDMELIIDVLLSCSEESVSSATGKPKPRVGDEASVMEVVPVKLETFVNMSVARLFVPHDLNSKKSRDAMGVKLDEVMRRMNGKPPLLDPLQNVGIDDPKFLKMVKSVEVLEKKLTTNPLFHSRSLSTRVVEYEKKVALQSQIADVEKFVRGSHSLIMKDELKAMKRVLRRLGFLSADNVVDVKGRVACEINTCDELLVTELMFNGAFNEMPVDHIVSLLSTLVFQEKVCFS